MLLSERAGPETGIPIGVALSLVLGCIITRPGAHTTKYNYHGATYYS